MENTNLKELLSHCIDQCQRTIDACQRLIDSCIANDGPECAAAVGTSVKECTLCIEICSQVQKQCTQMNLDPSYELNCVDSCQQVIDSCTKIISECKAGKIECLDECLACIQNCKECSEMCSIIMQSIPK